MGVFTSASNAGELHAKLEKAGIPSYVESRVHVGPFKTQKEADEARRKLKALGLGPGLLIPPQKR
jgi:cell division septation protein DedD